jgi:AbrB family looped-hinge helix DNA binding protein
MAKVTSKFQVTLPKAIADMYKIQPGDDIDWVAAGDVIRVIPPGGQSIGEDRDVRLRLFDQATERIRTRAKAQRSQPSRSRGWTREDLYTRGRTH